jgi:iron complex outermembrane receptor protein
MAIRMVGWTKTDAGYVDNVKGTRNFPGVASTTADDKLADNSKFADDNYNTIDTYGARASLRIDLNDEWTITPQLMGQKSEGKGSWGEDTSNFVNGENEVTHFQKEYTDDQWWQAGLTIEGSIGDFDMTYAGSYLDRDVDGSFDYSDYSYWYDSAYTTGYYADLHFANDGDRAVPNQFYDDAGSRIWPGARFTNDDGYTKQSHELRISSPQDKRLRGMVGLFYQKQEHDFQQHWRVAGLGDIMLLNRDNPQPRFDDTVYLNSMDRKDTDKAAFASVSFDITDDLEITGGIRYFEPETTVKGFFGFGLGFSPIWSGNGEAKCASQEDYKNKPCLNVDKGVNESDSVGRINLTWKISDEHMVYGTWSEGYRPGGINRNPDATDYVSDFLTNWEAGWKTEWFDNRLQLNGALFYEEWDDFQVSFAGDNAITQVNNGPSADVTGIEAQVLWVPIDSLTISAAFTYIDSELKDDYCPGCNDDGSPWAPSGTELPITADFKGNIVTRYIFGMDDLLGLSGLEGHMQAAVSYEGERGSDMNQADNDIRGDVPENTFVDLNFGISNETYSLSLFVKNATDEDAPLFLTSQCATGTCGSQNYGVRARPRTYGIRFSQFF